MAKSIIIAESSEIIRKGLFFLIESFDLFDSIKEVACAKALDDAMERYQQPDVLLVNPALISREKLENLRENSAGSLRMAAIIYSLYDEELLVLFDEVISVGDKRRKIEKKIYALLDQTPERKENKPEETLSAREMDVLKLLVKGLSNKEISDKLFISPHTVISHRKKITQKLNIKSVAGLTVYAIINEIITLDDVQ